MTQQPQTCSKRDQKTVSPTNEPVSNKNKIEKKYKENTEKHGKNNENRTTFPLSAHVPGWDSSSEWRQILQEWLAARAGTLSM